MDPLPVVAVRPLDGRVGSTLLIRLLATSSQVVIEPGYAEGERRYLSYCLRIAQSVATPWDPAQHPDVTQLLFGPAARTGPIPFEPSLVDIRRLAPTVLRNLWQAVSDELHRSAPAARYYAEKLVGDTQLLLDSNIPIHLIDLVRDPRDVFCSIRAFRAGAGRFGRTADQTDEQFLKHMRARHHDQLRAMASTPSNVRRTLIRYEDMVTDLAGAAEALGASLGLRLDAEALLPITGQERQHMTSRSPVESVGRWRHELSPSLAHELWQEPGPILEPMGYTSP
jgi:hypothetical protein